MQRSKSMVGIVHDAVEIQICIELTDDGRGTAVPEI